MLLPLDVFERIDLAIEIGHANPKHISISVSSISLRNISFMFDFLRRLTPPQ